MDTREIIQFLESKFRSDVLSLQDRGSFPFIAIQSKALSEVIRFCVSDSQLRFDYLNCITVVDKDQEFQVIYQVSSTTFSHTLNLKTQVERHQPILPTATAFWRAAFAYELEIAEMFGITFVGHPDPKPLLLPAEWQGHPLRKDYVIPEEYKNIEHRRDPLRKDHPRP